MSAPVLAFRKAEKPPGVPSSDRLLKSLARRRPAADEREAKGGGR